jgi:hypothetical protein
LAGLRPVAAGQVLGRARLAPQFSDDHVLLAPLLFNLLLARGWPGTDEDVQAAWELCGELGLHPLLGRMPAGLAQVVGETGWQLSNGERALVGLARALLAEPSVLVVTRRSDRSTRRRHVGPWPSRGAGSGPWWSSARSERPQARAWTSSRRPAMPSLT